MGWLDDKRKYEKSGNTPVLMPFISEWSIVMRRVEDDVHRDGISVIGGRKGLKRAVTFKQTRISDCAYYSKVPRKKRRRMLPYACDIKMPDLI